MATAARFSVPTRLYAGVFALALTAGLLLAALVRQPGYMDAYYYYNAAERLVSGNGLTDPYLWHYLNAPDRLPAPSHTYWMPLQSLLEAGAMALGGVTFRAAQAPAVLAYAGLVTLAFWLGERLGGTRRAAWISALLVLLSGFFTPFWATTGTFAVFGLAGSASLVALGLGRERQSARWFSGAGALAGAAHLARADGLLLLGVALTLALWPDARSSRRASLIRALAALAGYALIMAPWFARNLSVIGSPLPIGGTATIWLRGYNELVSYPPVASAQAFFDSGFGKIVASRWEALQANAGTFVAVETWVVLGPFALFGLWRLRREPLAQGAALYALGLHLIMTFIFAYPGYRGGLFHSSAALLPAWAASGIVGLDSVIAWASLRRGWRIRQAQTVFGAALVILAATLSLYALAARVPAMNANATIYQTIAADLPPGARLVINDPPALYYHTGLSGVVLPDSAPEHTLDLAERYNLDFLVLDRDRTAPFDALYRGETSYPFLRLERVYAGETPQAGDDVQVYAIVRSESEQP